MEPRGLTPGQGNLLYRNSRLDLRSGYELIEAAADPERPGLVPRGFGQTLQSTVLFWLLGVGLPLFNVYSLTAKWLDLPDRNPGEDYNLSKLVLGWTEFICISFFVGKLLVSAVGLVVTSRDRFNAGGSFHRRFFPWFLSAFDMLTFS